MKRRLIKLVHHARGATAIEYGMIVGMIAMAMMAGLSLVGSGTTSAWSNVATKVGAVEP